MGHRFTRVLAVVGALLLPLGAAVQADATVALPIRVDANGPGLTDSSGVPWAADWGYDVRYGGGRISAPVEGTTDDALYQTYNAFGGGAGYAFDLPDGAYRVTLKMVEDWATAAGQRRFDVRAEETTVLSAFDIYASCGRLTACDRSFVVEVADGRLNLRFSMNGGANHATVSAVEVTAVTATPSPTPTLTPTPSPTPTPTPTASPSPSPSPTVSPSPTPSPGGGRVVEVATAAKLKAALAAALPGDTIRLADGGYTGNFKATVAARPDARITITGSPGAVLTAGGGYGLHLNGASYWTVTGVTITGGQKGIMIDAAKGVVIDGVTVHDLDMEGVHFRNSSTDGVIRNSTIYDTGNNGRGMGEGVYVGTANTLTDNSDRIQIIGNTIGPDVGGENVDIKEGTTGARIIGNTFDGGGLTGANYDDSWVDVKGNDVLVQGNVGRNTTNNGYETHTQRPGWGCGTVFRDNASDLTGATGGLRLAINVTGRGVGCETTVHASNTVTGGAGLTNIPVTP
ncbi:malectin domain-containing carbohydrate-binding protein [Streptosporangium algeriense]|uniref:Malectin domain-containing carbohydrate-binding protein n=1 Tax=Streptosporangium algeriense TaxID=1682748 RepID=A0ABW3DK39_9ACTN